MTNNRKIEVVKSKIDDLETKLKYETDLSNRLNLLKQLLNLRREYTPLLLKKRPLLLTLGIVFALFYGISLMICLPPFIIRGKKRDINEAKIKAILTEISDIENKLKKESSEKESKTTEYYRFY